MADERVPSIGRAPTAPVARVVVLSVDELEEMMARAAERGARLALATPSTGPDEWLTSTGAAELLGVHRRTITKLAKRGELPSRRIGKLLRFNREALLEWLARREHEAA